MDLWLVSSSDKTHIRPTSIHGMLWLQTHFENIHWEAIASHSIFLDKSNAKILVNDAKQAGLIIHSVQPAITLNKI